MMSPRAWKEYFDILFMAVIFKQSIRHGCILNDV